MKFFTEQSAGMTTIAIALTGVVGYFAYIVVLEGKVTALLSNAGVEAGVPACGNGKVEAGEKCDDGNPYPLDGCTRCGIEAGFDCVNEPSVCRPAMFASSTSSQSSQSSMTSSAFSSGSSLSSVSSEASSSFAASSASSFSHSSDSPIFSSSSISTAFSSASIQRNLRRMLHEEPEGPIISSSAPAQVQAVSSAAYIKPFCGDGLIINEGCDDENAVSGDGCSALCAVESGYLCTGTPSNCIIACGDGIVMGSEKCDDGGNNPGDGCSGVCTIEAGYACNGAPSTCNKLTYCGDGVREGHEACDDGNGNAGDGCTPTCTLE